MLTLKIPSLIEVSDLQKMADEIFSASYLLVYQAILFQFSDGQGVSHGFCFKKVKFPTIAVCWAKEMFLPKKAGYWGHAS